MPKLGLALSGGGFRATLYHLGVIRYLRDAGALQEVSDIASVSGGSILAAHLVLNWDKYTGDEDDFSAAASEIIDFVQFDIRNHIVRRLPLIYSLKMFGKLARREMNYLSPNAVLEKYYRELLYGDTCLYELPDLPRLHILATNVSDGVLSVFNKNGLYIQRRNNDGGFEFEHIRGQMATLPRVVGASSAFPGFFPPVDISAEDLGVREGQFPTESFTDGGVYDNLGTRAFSWLENEVGAFDRVLVSDAGKPFQILGDQSLGFVGQSIRASDILWDRVWQLERENFGQHSGFSFLPITDVVSRDEDPTAQHPVVQAEVQSIRTDLDKFSDYEVNALVRHGYEVTKKVCRDIGLTRDHDDSATPWNPCPGTQQGGELANEKALASERGPSNATENSRELRNSSRRKVWSTLFDFRDWPTYVFLAVVLLAFVCGPVYVYRLRKHTELLTSMIDSIAMGDPDIRQILDLVEGTVATDWQVAELGELVGDTAAQLEGVEVLSQSRIFDLRNFDPNAGDETSRGTVTAWDRIVVRLNENYDGDKHVVFTGIFPMNVVEIRQPANQPQGEFKRVVESEDYEEKSDGAMHAKHQVIFDLSNVPIGERVTLQAMTTATVPLSMTGQLPFFVNKRTELLTSWLLFPENLPYSTYKLVRYPVDKSTPPIPMDPRFAIDHPFGSLIGWSVITPKEGMVYECRWTNQ
ncbi:MAG: hypothetical protein CMJ56_05595 [Planctomycetaceae bacterium]|nr:hypothetical protein [Planctomycetaceae bacterium]